MTVSLGRYDYSDPSFGLIVKPIVIEDGAWVGARAVICPGVRIGRQAVVAVGSVLTGDAEADGIYRGNPAKMEKTRAVTDSPHS